MRKAEKPANKAEQSAAERVEPRTGTKGNADQQSTRRAQDRESVSHALECVRKAARQRKKDVLDLWAERWRRRDATGDMIIVRYADDIIVGFEHEHDARCDA